MDRRAWLHGASAGALSTLGLLSLSLWPRAAGALARLPVGGKLSFSLPWPLERLDPHDAFDPIAALFAHAVVDTMFGVDAAGDTYPSLAAEPARVEGTKTIVRLRQGLVTARGRPLSAADVVFSIRRARELGGYPYWSDLPLPTPVAGDRLSIAVASTAAVRVARALACPLLAVVPRSFEPAQPDGTGAMRADFSAGNLVLTRNTKASRGASFLSQVLIEHAPDLSASLRAFEADSADLGWLGAGLHTPRPGAVAFDAGPAGFVVLRTGNEAGAWGAPGVAQQIIDGLPKERIQHLGLGESHAGEGAPLEWGGPRCELHFLQGSAQMEELARIIASLLSRPGHEVEPRALAAAELARRRSTGSYALMLHLLRAPGGPGLATLVALAAATDPKSALDAERRPPKLSSFAPNVLTRTMRLGVVGELRLAGAVAPDVFLAKGPEGWDFGSSYRALGVRRPP